MSLTRHEDEEWFDYALDERQNYENFSNKNIIELYKLQEIYRKKIGKYELENEEAIKRKLERIREIEDEILLERIKQVIIPKILNLVGSVLEGYYLQLKPVREICATDYITPFFKKNGKNCTMVRAAAYLESFPYYPGSLEKGYGHSIQISLYYTQNADLIISEREGKLITSKFYPYINVMSHNGELISIRVSLLMIRRFLDIKLPGKRITRKKTK